MPKTLEQYTIPPIMEEVTKEVLEIFADKEKRKAYTDEVEQEENFQSISEIKKEIVFHTFWLMRRLFSEMLPQFEEAPSLEMKKFMKNDVFFSDVPIPPSEE